MSLITKITIPDYPDKILISKSRKAKYYVSEKSKVAGKKDLPKRCLNREKYSFDERGVLIDISTGEPVIANPRTVGKPRYWVVNFQDIWNGNMARQSRASKVEKLKEILRPYIKKAKKIKQFPVEISLIIYDTQCPVDISNRGAVYTKVIEDLLVKEGVLPDDSAEYVNCSGRIKFIKVDDEKKKKLEVLINKSDNKPF